VSPNNDAPNLLDSRRAFRGRSRRRLRRRALRIALAVLLPTVVASAWVGASAFLVKSELEQAVPLVDSMRSDVISGDVSRLGASSEQVVKHAREAARLADGPIWSLFESVPLLGPNLSALRKIAHVVDDVSAHALAPLTDLAVGTGLERLAPVDGAVDVGPLIDAQPQVAAANRTLVRARAQVERLDTSGTVQQIILASRQLDSALIDASTLTDAADRAVTLLPSMLGNIGDRKYLLLFQNNAELRAAGGLPGALALVEIHGGRVNLTRQVTGASFQEFGRPVVELPLETRGIYSDRLSTYMGDVTLTPYFPTTGQIAQAMWKQKFGEEVDGVISLDPVALSYLLRATGPITLASGDVLTSDNAVQLLLTDAYTRYDSSDKQDVFFADAASATFGAIAGGQAKPGALINALAQASRERRVLIWSANEHEQQLLEGTTLTGDLPVSDAEVERFGVYLNDATGAKMDTYLDVQIALGEASCREDGRPYYAVDVTLKNSAPVDAANALPESITGPGTFGVQKGHIKTLILIYGPKSAQNLGMSRDGNKIQYHPATDSGYPVSQTAVELAPGESATTRTYLLGATPAHGKLEAVSTPVINPHETPKLGISCESPLG
jgi:hypothetical protein